MRRSNAVLASVICVTAAYTAPIPRELKSPAIERLFGTPSDPSGKCEFALQGETLRVVVPGDVECAATHLKGAPRTSRIVEGDFVAVVKVSYHPPKDEDGKATGHFGAGLAAWVDDQTYVFINRHHWPAGAGKPWSGGFDTHIHLPDVNPVSHGATCEGTGPELWGLLRLTRKGNEFTTEESRDGGKTWNRTGRIEGIVPGKLQVGVVAVNATKLKAEVMFEGFVVKSK
jgi:hypothetical protein